jgi:hypothetical protein
MKMNEFLEAIQKELDRRGIYDASLRSRVLRGAMAFDPRRSSLGRPAAGKDFADFEELVVVSAVEITLNRISIREIGKVSAPPPEARVVSSPPSSAGPFVFRWIVLFLPQRLCIEDLGDALEVLAALEAEGAPRWERWAKITSTCFWLIPSVLREWISALRGNAGAERQRRRGDGR